MKNIFLLIFFAAAISSCSNTKKMAGNKDLYNLQWNLTKVQGITVLPTSNAALNFTADNKVSGSTGCNRLNGSFTSSGSTIKFSPLAVTRMACLDGDANNTETKFLAAIQKATSWSVENGQLILSDASGVLAKLQGVKPVTAEEKKLNGSWELNYISGAKIAFEGLFPAKKPFISFNLPRTEASGNGGCNGFGCKVNVDGNKIKISQVISTMMACEGGGESVFFKTLESVTSYSISDDTLTMISGDIAVMRFKRK
ncbi:META domain-containing protein [Ferruginibacter sp.]